LALGPGGGEHCEEYELQKNGAQIVVGGKKVQQKTPSEVLKRKGPGGTTVEQCGWVILVQLGVFQIRSLGGGAQRSRTTGPNKWGKVVLGIPPIVCRHVQGLSVGGAIDNAPLNPSAGWVSAFGMDGGKNLLSARTGKNWWGCGVNSTRERLALLLECRGVFGCLGGQAECTTSVLGAVLSSFINQLAQCLWGQWGECKGQSRWGSTMRGKVP